MTTTGRRIMVSTIAFGCWVAWAQNTAAYSPPEVYVPGIIETWEAQAGQNRDAVGFALSLAFVNWPSVFLRQMADRPETFRAWLGSLEQHTFKRPDEPGRGAWVVRQMHRLAVRWDGVRYHEMTESIRQATEEILAGSEVRN